MNQYLQPGWEEGQPREGALEPAANVLALPASHGNSTLSTPKVSYWQLAWNHKLVLSGFLLLGGLVGTGFVLLKTPLYTATATVELVGFNQSFMGMSQVDPQAGTDTTTASVSNIQTQSRVLTSRNLRNRVVERLNLEMTPVTSTPPTFFTKLRNRLPYLHTEPLAQSREAVAIAAYTVSAHGLGATRLIEIQCESTSPEVAASFVNTLAEEHIALALQARATLTQRTSQWMDSQLEESKARLQDAGEKLREFVRTSGLDFFPEQTTLADTKFRQLQTDVGAAQADRINKQSRWELAKSTPLELLPDVLNDTNLQNLKTRIGDLRREMAQQTTTLTPQNYKVQKTQAQITELESTLEKEKTGVLKRLQGEYEEAQKREKLLLDAYNKQTHAVSGQLDKASQYAMLKRNVEVEQQLYNMLLQQSNQAALMALAPSSSIQVVDPALVPLVPSSPNPLRDIPTATLAGGAIGFGLLLLLDALRRKKFSVLFDAPGHTQTLLGVPELGVIPSARLEQPKKQLSDHRLGWVLHRRSAIEAPKLNGENGYAAPEFAKWQSDKSSLLAESFRQTLISLLGTKTKDHNPIYVITSAGPGEGKTTLCANLAAAMADIGQRVLIIDADLRRSRLHRLFGTEDRPGLSDLLASSTSLEDAKLDEFIQPTPVKNLKVMTQGVAEVDTPALLFFSPRTEKLIALLRGRYDCIFFDTAPSLAFPDARLLGKHADGIVLVVRAGITSREGASVACQRFLDDGIPVLGTILNDWTPRDRGGQNYYQYGYGAYGKQ